MNGAAYGSMLGGLLIMFVVFIIIYGIMLYVTYNHFGIKGVLIGLIPALIKIVQLNFKNDEPHQIIFRDAKKQHAKLAEQLRYQDEQAALKQADAEEKKLKLAKMNEASHQAELAETIVKVDKQIT